MPSAAFNFAKVVQSEFIPTKLQTPSRDPIDHFQTPPALGASIPNPGYRSNTTIRRNHLLLPQRASIKNSQSSKMISDAQLYSLALFLGAAAMLLIVLYHFLEVNAKDSEPLSKERQADAVPQAQQKAGKAKS